uniref:SHR-BD domain-containing protein n=1 Tax=Panagrellus redivivus TaxID=6233 RepID=A0A7E4V652_PANRE
MALKRRSLSTVSAMTVLGNNGEKLINATLGNGTYRHLTDMSPTSLPASPEVMPKKSPTARLFLKKANVYNFMRRRSKTGEALRSSVSSADLTDSEKGCGPAAVENDGNLADSGMNGAKMVQCCGKSENSPGYSLYMSFSFGVDKYLKRPVATHRKFLSSRPKSVYRCLIYAADWAKGSAYKLIGATELVSLTPEDSNLQFSFVAPVSVHYDYALDTNLRFELQCARASSSSSTDKWFTTNATPMSPFTSTPPNTTNTSTSTMTASSYLGGGSSSIAGESIDKAPKRWRPAESGSDLPPGVASLKFLTIATTCCDLNGLVNRGFLKADMKMRSDLAAPATMYLGTEPSLANVKLRNSEPWTLAVKFNARQSNARMLSATTPYRLLISRFFMQANAFISVYKSPSFLLNFSNSHFSVEIEKIQLSAVHFVKTDSLFRFAIIDAESEKWVCFADVQGNLLNGSQTMFEVPISESATSTQSTTDISTSNSNISRSSSLRTTKSFNMGVFRIWGHHHVPNPFRSSVTESASLTSAPSCSGTPSMRSSSVSTNSKPPSINVTRSESLRDSRSSASGDSRSSCRSSSTYSYSLASSNGNNKCVYDEGLEDAEQDEDTMIVTGHTQAYLMSLLVPNKRILVREVYPNHVRICERRC